jgi:hypothetical protein
MSAVLTVEPSRWGPHTASRNTVRTATRKKTRKGSKMIKDNKLILFDQRILWADLQGTGDKFNPPGRRQFLVTVPKEDVENLQEMGWTVRGENDERGPFVRVRVDEKTYAELYPKFALPKPWEETTLVIVGVPWRMERPDRSGIMLFLEDIKENSDG